jgi:hypothetical protein
MSITASTRFELPADVVARDVGGEVMILHLGTAIYFGLNEVGSRAWQLMLEQRPFAEVCAAIADEFDAPADQIRQDVEALTTTLLQKGLIAVAA